VGGVLKEKFDEAKGLRGGLVEGLNKVAACFESLVQVCCSVFQCVAECCRVLQCVAV